MVLSSDSKILEFSREQLLLAKIAFLRLFHHYVLIFSENTVAAKKIFSVVNTTDHRLGLTVWPHCSEELSKLRRKDLGYHVRNV